MEIDFKNYPSELGIWMIIRAGLGKFMMSLEHFVVPKSKGKKGMRHVKGTQEPICKRPKLEQFKQLNK